VWFASSLTRASLSTDQKLKTWARKMTNKKPRKYNGMVGGPDVETKTTKQHGYLTERTNPCYLLAHCFIHIRIEEISTLLAGSTRVSTYPARGADPP